jgi:alkanesulfonate monooxygenase SsuD/methylene tetrahydromethanopterin reductase-like flavin-dependent oxidoreductase (luciferase family)
MKVGLFDHVERCDRPLATAFDERLQFAVAAEAAGIYCLHVAEHHGTPLNMVPVPGVYLGALTRATKRLRLGPLVYLLPLYSPLRLIEEIAILDHMSHGRLDVGVGRGVSAYELNFHKVDPETSREVFIDAFDAVYAGLTHDRLTYHGKHFSYDNVPMELRSLQQPHPPFWYPSSNETGSTWAGERGLNFSTLGSVERASGCIKAYKDALAKRGGPILPNKDFPGGVGMSINRQAVVADSEADAMKIARPAFERFHQSLTKLERDNAGGPRFAHHITGDLDAAIKSGQFIVGTPDSVRANIERQVKALGVNYMIFSLFFGEMSFESAMRSLKLFSAEVLPRLASL